MTSHRDFCKATRIPFKAFESMDYRDALGWLFLGGFSVVLKDEIYKDGVVGLFAEVEKEWMR